jgi:hypothetical protein
MGTKIYPLNNLAPLLSNQYRKFYDMIFLVYPRVFRRSVDDTSHLFVRPIHYGFANFDIGKARYKWGGQVEIRILVGNNSIVTSYVASKGHVHVCAGTLSYIIHITCVHYTRSRILWYLI